MTNYNESPDDKLTEILRELDRGEYLDKGGVPGAKQAILNWHNKQVEEVLDRLLEHGEDFTTFGDGSRSVAVEYIQAERNKLKEQPNDQL